MCGDIARQCCLESEKAINIGEHVGERKRIGVNEINYEKQKMQWVVCDIVAMAWYCARGTQNEWTSNSQCRR